MEFHLLEVLGMDSEPKHWVQPFEP